jgi:Zn-dependent protease
MYSWYSLAGVLAFLFLGRPLLVRILLFNRMQALRVRHPKSYPIARQETAPAEAATMASIEPELESAGLIFEQAEIQIPDFGEKFTRPLWIFADQERLVRVSIHTQITRVGNLPICTFVTLMNDGGAAYSGIYMAIEKSNRIARYNQIANTALTDQLAAHRAFVASLAPAQPVSHLSLDKWEPRFEAIWDESAALRLKSGELKRVGTDEYAYSALESWRRASRSLAAVRILTKSPHVVRQATALAESEAGRPGIDEEIARYYKLDAQTKISNNGAASKVIALVVTLALFLLAFHLAFSWQIVLLLLGVLTFHEGSHLLGMRIFGYQNLRMLYLPFLGAVAIGAKKDYVPPWKELVILFLGPLPGFMLGLLVMLNSALERLPLRTEIAGMLIFVNLFNLAPVFPLDGGQILDILLFRRFSYARVAFLGLSAIALILTAAFGILPYSFAVFGGLFIYQLRSQLQRAKVSHYLKQELGKPLAWQDERTLLAAIFEYIRQSREMPADGTRAGLLAKNNKILSNPLLQFSFVRQVLAQCKSDPAPPLTCLLAIVAYTSPAWVAFLALRVEQHRTHAAIVAELANDRATGLLDIPHDQRPLGQVDGTQAFLQIDQSYEKWDMDERFQRIKHTLSSPEPDLKTLQIQFQRPEMVQALVLARKVAMADYITPQKYTDNVGISNLTEWLCASAVSSALLGDSAQAWSDLEAALHSICVVQKSPDGSTGGAMYWQLSQALRACEVVMSRISPSAGENARLKSLISMARLRRPMLIDSIGDDVDQLTNTWEEYRQTPLTARLYNDFSQNSEVEHMHLGEQEIRDLKDQLKAMDSSPSVAGEAHGANDIAIFGDRNLAALNLANAALALEEYRAENGRLPDSLHDVSAMSDTERSEIIWRPKRNLLVDAGAFQNSNGKLVSDQDPPPDSLYAKGYSPYRWKLAPGSK